MRFGMMAAVGVLAAMAGMAHGEGENGKSLSVPSNSSAGERERVMGVCLPVEMTRENQDGVLTLSPTAAAAHYMEFFAKQPLSSILSFDSILIKQQPSHGTLTREKNAVGRSVYVYRPNFGYLGKDRFEAVVPVGIDSVRIIYNVVVQPDLTDQEDFERKKHCPKTEWKISRLVGNRPGFPA